MRRASGLVRVVVGIWVATSLGGAEPPRWKLEPGAEHYYTLAQTTTLDSTPEGGRTIHAEWRQEVDLRWIVGEAEGDSARVALLVDRVRAHVERDGLPPGGFDFDTAFDAAAAGDSHAARLGAVLKGLVGTRLEFRMTPRGEPRDVKFPRESSAAARGAAVLWEGAPASEDALWGLVATSIPFLPEGPAEPGAVWTRQSIAPMPALGSLVLDKTYTDRGPRPDRPEIRDVDVETRFSLRPMPGSLMETTLENQSGAGSFAFDVRRGLVESGRLEDALTIRFGCSEGCRVVQESSTRLSLKLLPDPMPSP